MPAIRSRTRRSPMPWPRTASPSPDAPSPSTATSSRSFRRASGIADRPQMRSILLRSLVVIGAGGLVLAGLLYVASTVDARPPAVLDVRLTQPQADDAQRALITTSLEVVFSETVDMDSAAAALRLEPAAEGAVSWSGSTMICTPRDPLALETSYAVSVGGGVRDLAGNEMEELP